MTTPPDDGSQQTIRLAAIREDLAKRLRPINRDMPCAEFNALMEKMAHLQHRFEQPNRDRGADS